MKKKLFTLIELILVVFILGLIASSALLVVDNQDGQERYDESKRRLTQIRYALLGKDEALSSESYKISGYLADMGDTPASISDLLNKPASATDWTYNSTLGFGTGWRGPYINSFDESFTDGWGHSFKDSDNNDWDGAEVNGDLEIIAFNQDGSKGGIEYSRDLTLEIPQSTYKNSGVLNFDITLINESGAAISESYQLMILYPDANLPTNFTTDNWSGLNSKFQSEETQSVNLQTASPDNRGTYSFTLDEELIHRKLRIFLVQPGAVGTSLQDKIINNPDSNGDGNPDRYDHIHLYPQDLTNLKYTFRIK